MEKVSDVDGRGGYRYHISPSPSHNSGGIGRLLGLSVHVHDISGHGS